MEAGEFRLSLPLSFLFSFGRVTFNVSQKAGGVQFPLEAAQFFE